MDGTLLLLLIHILHYVANPIRAVSRALRRHVAAKTAREKFALHQKLQDDKSLDGAIHAVNATLDLLPESSLSGRLIDLAALHLKRYERINDPGNLNEAISLRRRVVGLLPEGDMSKTLLMAELCYSLWTRYQRAEDLADLEAGIVVGRHAISELPGEHEMKPKTCTIVAMFLRRRFKRNSELDVLAEAIAMHRLANDLTPNDHPEKPSRLRDLGVALEVRFQFHGDPHDLDDAIAAGRLAIDMLPNNHPSYASLLEAVCSYHKNRFERLGERNDIDNAISFGRRAIGATPADDPAMPIRLSLLGLSLMRRFGRAGDLHDLEEAISRQRCAATRVSSGQHNKGRILSRLGMSLLAYFRRLGKLEDLHEAIVVHRLAVDVTPDGHPDKPMCLNNLSLALRSRFVRLGAVQDLDDAIGTIRSCIDISPRHHRDKALRMVGFGSALKLRFEHLDEFPDLESAISAQQSAVEMTPHDSPRMPGMLSDLSESHRHRFERLGELDDLEMAISLGHRSVELTPEDDPAKPARLNQLGIAFRRRFERLGEFLDVEKAISTHGLAVELSLEWHPSRGSWLINFGIALGTRFDGLGDRHDLDRAISAIIAAVEMTPTEHITKPRRLAILGNTLRRRYILLGDVADLDRAIFLLREALNLVLESHSTRKALLFDYLGIFLQHRFEHSGALDDLQEAISMKRLAVEAMPDGNPYKLSLLHNLAASLEHLFRQSQSQVDFDATIRSLEAVTAQTLGVPALRLHSAKHRAWLLQQHPNLVTTEKLLKAHSDIINVLPDIAWLGHNINRRYDDSAHFGELVNNAVAAATRHRSLTQAIEWLEAGRSLIWSQILSLRAPPDVLREQYPELADSLLELSQALVQSSRTTTLTAVEIDELRGDGRDFMAKNESGDRHRQLAIQYDRLMVDIRSRPGFERFLRPPVFDAIVPALAQADGPIVFINVSSSSCEALIISPGGSISLVDLRDLTQTRALALHTHWIRHLTWCDSRTRGAVGPLTGIHGRADMLVRVLERLWTWVVQPVLGDMDMLTATPPSRLPHITWCPTGSLSQLPLHAAGLYSSDHTHHPHVFDYAVSSYTPSLSALLRCHQRRVSYPRQPDILIIAQPETRGLPRLPGTEEECDRLRAALSHESNTFLGQKEATIERTLSALSTHPWVHLACHGSQDTYNPTQSAFRLDDGPLTLSALMATASDHAELAFLSACQTAVGDEKIPEESVHLAAGMLAVGFKGVIATMWSIKDADAPIVVEAYYKKLLELRGKGGADRRSCTGAAYALHEAVGVLRERVGERDVVRWAPFVHFGI